MKKKLKCPFCEHTTPAFKHTRSGNTNRLGDMEDHIMLIHGTDKYTEYLKFVDQEEGAAFEATVKKDRQEVEMHAKTERLKERVL